MTLQELCMLIKRKLWIVVACVLVCALAGGGYSMLQKRQSVYEATALIVPNLGFEGTFGLANSLISEKTAGGAGGEFAGVTLKVESKPSNYTITITGTGSNDSACIEAVNKIADAAAEGARAMYEGFKETPYECTVVKAQTASLQQKSNLVKFAGIGAAAGLFIALCLLVLIDLRKQKIKTAEVAHEVAELPVLATLPKDMPDKLLANAQFSAERAGATSEKLKVLVIPANQIAAAEATSAALTSASKKAGVSLEVTTTAPLTQSMDGAYAAQKADIVLVTVAQWHDSLPELKSCVDELRFAEAILGGIVFVSDK